jgi:hypothetical protein
MHTETKNKIVNLVMEQMEMKCSDLYCSLKIRRLDLAFPEMCYLNTMHKLINKLNDGTWATEVAIILADTEWSKSKSLEELNIDYDTRAAATDFLMCFDKGVKEEGDKDDLTSGSESGK